jgi:CIC family chloride channel protein
MTLQKMIVPGSSDVQVPETELARKSMFKALLYRDRTPVAVLICAAIVGTLVGFAGVAFFRAVNAVQHWRISFLQQADLSGWALWIMAFIISGLLAVMGYFLVRRFAPEASGSGIPEIEGALEELRPVRWWRVIPVKFLAVWERSAQAWCSGEKGQPFSSVVILAEWSLTCCG